MPFALSLSKGFPTGSARTGVVRRPPRRAFPARGYTLCPTAMVRPRPEEFDKKKIVAENRRARFDYAIEDKYEAGIALTGTEVKSLRFGEGSIAESYAEVK